MALSHLFVTSRFTPERLIQKKWFRHIVGLWSESLSTLRYWVRTDTETQQDNSTAAHCRDYLREHFGL